MVPTTIRHLFVEDMTIELHEPFGIAGGAQEQARNLLVTVELDDGTCGYGEAAPFAAFNGETPERARMALETARVIVEGADVREWRAIAAALAAQALVGSARCAIETAILDALLRRAALPLWAFFGGATTSLETDMTITTGSVEAATAAAHDILARGITTIKVKIGGGDLQLDLDRLRAIHAVAPFSPLILDGNGGYTADSALQLLALLHERGIRPVLFEQPVAGSDYSGLRQVSRWGGVRVAADESVTGVADVLALANERAMHVVNIKLMKCGIVEALDIAAVARSRGLGLMICVMVESTMALTVSACLAAGLGGFQFVDLDTPLFMVQMPLQGGMRYDGSQIRLDAITAGHGVVPLGSPGIRLE